MSDQFDQRPQGGDPAYGAPQEPGYYPPSYPYWGPPPPPPPVAPSRNRNLAIIGGVAAAVVVVAIVAAVAVLTLRSSAPMAGPEAPPPQPQRQTATTCTHSESSGEVPETGMVSAGGLSFPLSVAPDWERKAEHRVPNSIDAVSLAETVSETEDMTWIGQVTVGITNFAPSLSLSEQAELMVKCIVGSELYDRAAPKLGEFTPVAGRLDGMPTSTIDVPITVTIDDPTVRGDDLVVIIVGTNPTTYFMGSSPIGDADRRSVVEAAIQQLHVSAL